MRFRKSGNTNVSDVIQAAVSAALVSFPSLPTTLDIPMTHRKEMSIGVAFGLSHENEDRETNRALVDKPAFERYLWYETYLLVIAGRFDAD